MEALVRIYDPREIKDLRRLLKNLNTKLTVRELPTISISQARVLAWRELAKISGYETRKLLRLNSDVLDAIANCNNVGDDINGRKYTDTGTA